MKYKNQELETEFENNKNAKNKALEKIQEIVNEYVDDNPDLEFKVRVANRGIFSEDIDNPVIKCSITNKKVFWISTVSFEYDIKLKDLYDFSNSSGGTNKVKPIEVVNAYQEIYNSIDCLNNGLQNDNTKLLELASDILYYDNKLMDINIDFKKQKDNYVQEFVTEKLSTAGIKRIGVSDQDIQKAESVLQRLEENGHVILYVPDIDTFKYN